MSNSNGADALAAILTATGPHPNPELVESMLEGSHLESTWVADANTPGNGAWGLFQLQLAAHPGVTEEDADNEDFAAKFMEPSYKAALALVPQSLWKSDPARAAEEVAYGAERPEYNYYEGQGADAVNAAWAATKSVYDGTGGTGSDSSSGSGATPATDVSKISDVTGLLSSGAGGLEKAGGYVLAIAAGAALIGFGIYKTVSPSPKGSP